MSFKYVIEEKQTILFIKEIIMHHYMTKYTAETDNKKDEIYVSWLQINILWWHVEFSKKFYVNGKRVR